MAMDYDSGRWSAVQHLKMAAEAEVGSELENRHIATARVCASVAMVDGMQRIADALVVLGNKARDFQKRQ
jgi:hypothetical protein